MAGEAFISTLTSIASVWDGAQWTDIAKPVVIPYPDDNALLGDSPPDNTVALSEASGNVFSRVNGKWLPLGLRLYPTQAGLAADTPPNGTLAYAEDTGAFAVRNQGAWATLTNQGVFIGVTAPPNPLAGQQWYEAATSTLWTYDGAKWVPPAGGVPVGTLIHHVSFTPPSGYLLCDGSAVPAGTGYDALRAVIGGNLPDFKDKFLRGAKSQHDIDGFRHFNDTTRLPRKAFTGIANTAGNHSHGMRWNAANTDGNWAFADAVFAINDNRNPQNEHFNKSTSGAGNHTHTVSLNGGGDPETAPPHSRVAVHIKAF